MTLYVGLGIILLSRTDILPFWRVGQPILVSVAGNTPFDPSLSSLPIFDNNIIQFFFDWKDSLSDPFNVWPITPLSCSGDYCLSVFLPGAFEALHVEDTLNSTGDSVVVYDIPGYQIEFYPMSSTDPSFDLPNDCQFYNDSIYYGNTICMKTEDNEILFGIALSRRS
jgi:hypothetical protein